MASMFKKLKGLFIVEEKIGQKSGQEVSPDAERAHEMPKESGKLPEVSVEPIHGHIEDKFLRVLFKAMDNNNLDGFDYLEFKQFLRSLNAMEMDDETRFKSAFATARTVGASAKAIEESADHYLDILKNEKTKFEAAVTRQRALQVEKGHARIEIVKTRIEEKRAAMSKLEAEIRELEMSLSDKQDALEKAATKIEQTSEDFIRTHSLLVEQIHDDLEKIRTFLS